MTQIELAPDQVAGAKPTRLQIWILVGGFLLATGLVVWGAIQSRFILGNIDGISYISLARQYADGQWDTAINAYWSPLISWLIAPLLVLGLPEILAFNLVCGIAGLAAVGIGGWLVWSATHRNFWATGIFMLCSSVFTIGNLYSLTPDMLVVAWVLLFLAVLMRASRDLAAASVNSLMLRASALGVVGVLGYVTKLYLVPVFVVVLIAWVLLAALTRTGQSDGRAGFRAPALLAMAALVVALLLALPWIATLSVKYGMLTAGSSFAVNIESKFEPAGPGEGENALNLWAPPNENAISFGEDRTHQVDGVGFQSESSLVDRATFYVSQRIAAFPHYINKIGSIAPWAILILSFVGLGVLWGRITMRRHALLVMSAVMAGIYFVGYAAITSASSGGGNSRYYWPLLLLSTLAACLLLPAMWRQTVAAVPRWRKVVAVAIVALLPIGVLTQHGLGKSAPFSTVSASPGWGYLLRTAEPSSAEQLAQLELSEYIPAGSKLVGSNYRATLTFAYYLDSQVFGRAEQGYDPTSPRFQQLLRDNGIDFYLAFTPIGSEPLNLEELGPTLESFQLESTCDDRKGSAVVPCQIDLIAVR